MSTAGVTQKPAPPVRAARRFVNDAMILIALPLRRSRRPGARAPMPPAAWLVACLFAAAVTGFAMFFLDAWVAALPKRLPIPIIDAFNRITDFGKSNWFLWPSGLLVIALAAIAAGTSQRRVRWAIIALVVRFEFIFAAIALPGLAVSIVKRLIGRVRPSALGPFAYVPFSWRPDYASMPSGHATTAFAAAVALGALWPRARPVLWLYAVVIAASRVIISAHYPSDVIAGACVGGFGALILRNYFAGRHLGFAVTAAGSVVRLPGPSQRRIRSIAARLFVPAA